MTGSIERALQFALKTWGVPWCYPIGLGELYERGTVVPLDTSGVTTIADSYTGGVKCLNMAATATTAAGVFFNRPLTSKFAVSATLDHGLPKLSVLVKARRYDASGSAADDTALGLVGTATLNGLTTADSFTLSGITKTPSEMGTNATNAGWVQYEYDLTAAMTDAQKKLLTVSHSLKFELSPSKTVGTGLALQVEDIEMKPYIFIGA